jgi:hypothetical protein
MSFRLFIYYCALVGGWAAFFGFWLGLFLSPSSDLGSDGFKGMWLGMTVAFGLGLVDALWNLSFTQAAPIAMRLAVGVLVGSVGGLLGGVLGHVLFSLMSRWGAIGYVGYIFGWTLTGFLVGASIGVYEMLSSVVRQQDFSGSLKKLIKGVIGGTAGGILGSILSLILQFGFSVIFPNKEPKFLWSPTGWGFVALGMCIGLLIGLAQVMLKEAWVKIEVGKRSGREMILTKEKTTIGRAEACDIGLFGDNAIERMHANILLAGNRYYVEDASTPAGTFVNDQPVVGRVPLKSGDKIRVGSNVLCFGERARRQ